VAITARRFAWKLGRTLPRCAVVMTIRSIEAQPIGIAEKVIMGRRPEARNI
jgi:hypothetical protein